MNPRAGIPVDGGLYSLAASLQASPFVQTSTAITYPIAEAFG